MKDNPRPTITFDQETYKQLKNIANRENKSVSAVVREMVDESLKLQANTENIDMITKIIREQLRDVMQPGIDRLAALTAKTCVQSSTAAYLTAETISKFVPVKEQEDFRECYEKARKKGVEYTRRKPCADDNEE